MLLGPADKPPEMLLGPTELLLFAQQFVAQLLELDCKKALRVVTELFAPFQNQIFLQDLHEPERSSTTESALFARASAFARLFCGALMLVRVSHEPQLSVSLIASPLISPLSFAGRPPTEPLSPLGLLP